MAVKNFGGSKNNAVNYGIRTLENGNRIFVTECEATDPGAIKFTRQKDSPSGAFKAGDVFYAKGGNAISGVLKGLWVRDGFGGGAAKELNVGFASINEKGEPVTEFVKLPLVSDKGRLDNATARVLIAMNKADLGEEVALAVHTFKHKAGEKIVNAKGEDTGKVWEKDGANVVMSLYQEHLSSEHNPNGRVTLEAGEHYTQPTFFVKGKEVVTITHETKVPEGAVVQYDVENAAGFYADIVNSVMSRIGDAAKAAPPAANNVSDDDMTFGGDAEEQAARTRMGSRP